MNKASIARGLHTVMHRCIGTPGSLFIHTGGRVALQVAPPLHPMASGYGRSGNGFPLVWEPVRLGIPLVSSAERPHGKAIPRTNKARPALLGRATPFKKGEQIC